MLTSRLSRATPIAAALALSLFGMLLHGCTELPCMDNGTTSFRVPEARLPFLESIEARGVCDVYVPTEGCDAGHCFNLNDAGQLSLLFLVIGRAHGTCTVAASFSDGMEPLSHRYKFAGPLGNCCAEICPRG